MKPIKLQTLVPVSAYPNPLGYGDNIFGIGSCFAVHMSQKFAFYKFEQSVNPFGILFHPLAIEKLFEYTANNVSINREDLVFQNEKWFCWHAHSDIHHNSEDDLLALVNTKLLQTRQELQTVSVCIITLGTAWVYKHKQHNQVVANCHKVPQHHFEKCLLSVSEVERSLGQICKYLHVLNPHLKVIFTISPVRHLKDGFVENQRSKSHLISALHHFLEINQNPNISYFPAYELVMDELRDYRFYAPDLLHPNEVAIDYIWARFTEKYISSEGLATMQKVSDIQKRLQHRPFDRNTEMYKKFQQELYLKMDALQKQWPHINFDLPEP
ncbi:MAG: GSCFA domain-containing protein [Flavobacteriaceae bacterium]|nr:GSCFA domain-containing protein [Flavobacteriaceae bacterium]